MTDTDTKPLLVAASSRGIGTTTVTAALGRSLQDRGRSVEYLKPVGTRLREADGAVRDEDPAFVRRCLGLNAQDNHTRDDDRPATVAYSRSLQTKLLRGEVDPDELRATVKSRVETLAARADRVLLEGAGRRAAGRLLGLADPQLAALVNARVLVLTDYDGPEDVDPVLAAADAYGDRLVGVVFNGVPPAKTEFVETIVRSFCETRDVPIAGVLPTVPELTGVTAATLAAELGAETLVKAGAERRIRESLVGAMGPERALAWFRRAEDAAVITGGDRSEIQAAAVESSGVGCLVVTGGHAPARAILDSARRQEVPVLRLRTDTRTALDRVGEIVAAGRTRDEAAVERMTALLAEHADIESILKN